VIPNIKHLKILVALLAVMVAGLALASTASAECGPGFTNKKQLIHYYQNNPSAEHGFRQWLLKNSAYTGFQADETVINWLKSPEQRVFNAPSGYHLKTNTYCPGGPGQYAPYHGLLDNMGGLPMLWHCDKEGNNCVPILKGYCMNAVTGKPCHKHHKHHHPRCKCRKHHHKHHRPNCKAVGKTTGPAGTCVNQTVTVTPKQECESNNHSTTGCQQTTVTIVANCSNVAVGNEGYVGQGGNCQTGGEQTCVGQGNCVVEEEKPCGCEPKKEPSIKITSKTELNMIPAGKTSGDFGIGTYASESGGVLTVDPGIGGVSSCSSTTPKGSITVNVPSGASEACVILYAPEDADKPASMTVTMTACLGSVCDVKTETVPITYPKRP
jgi:hypothetical protein